MARSSAPPAPRPGHGGGRPARRRGRSRGGGAGTPARRPWPARPSRAARAPAPGWWPAPHRPGLLGARPRAQVGQPIEGEAEERESAAVAPCLVELLGRVVGEVGEVVGGGVGVAQGEPLQRPEPPGREQGRGARARDGGHGLHGLGRKPARRGRELRQPESLATGGQRDPQPGAVDAPGPPGGNGRLRWARRAPASRGRRPPGISPAVARRAHVPVSSASQSAPEPAPAARSSSPTRVSWNPSASASRSSPEARR